MNSQKTLQNTLARISFLEKQKTKIEQERERLTDLLRWHICANMVEKEHPNPVLRAQEILAAELNKIEAH